MAATPQIAPFSVPTLAASGGAGIARSTAPKGAAKIVAPASAFPSRIGNLAEMAVPLAVLGIVVAMIMPLPSFLLDLLISANITLSVVVLLVSMYITKPVEF